MKVSASSAGGSEFGVSFDELQPQRFTDDGRPVEAPTTVLTISTPDGEVTFYVHTSLERVRDTFRKAASSALPKIRRKRKQSGGCQ
jgi:hypothetical protein